MSKVDKLFKDKLESDSLQPSAQAWEKVEAHLGKKNKMVLWLRVAAAVVLLGVLTFVGLNWESGYEETKEVAGNKSQETGVDSVAEKQIEPTIVKKETVKPKKQLKAQPKVIAPIQEQPVEQLAVVPEPEVEREVEQPIIIKQQPKANKGITLTYSLPPIKKEVSEPLIADEKKSGLDRVLEIAMEVKNGDNPLGELREAKNDILALEFRKDKSKKH